MKGVSFTKAYRLFLIIIATILFLGGVLVPQAHAEVDTTATETLKKIEEIAANNLDRIGASGVSVVVVKDDKTIFNQGFGYADIDDEKPITTDTLFEIGSTSKAFTALGVLHLRDKGLIELDAPVKQYLPWFKLIYKDEEAVVTLRQLLNHTSEIPTRTIGEIPITEGEHALEETVRNLIDQEIKYPPGDRFIYSTINYDVLALVIQEVTGQPFAEYMAQEIFKPLNLNDTYMGRGQAPADRIADGHKWMFGSPRYYDAPYYGGNEAAAYVITSSTDLGQWLKIQLGTANVDEHYMRLAKETQQANRSVPPSFDGSSYGMGWNSLQLGGGQLFHDGTNPGFFSNMVVRPAEKLGVAVISNTSSYISQKIAGEIMNYLIERDEVVPFADTYQRWDKLSSIVTITFAPLIAALLYATCLVIVQIFRRTRTFAAPTFKRFVTLLLTLPVMAGFYLCIYFIPDLFLFGNMWSMADVYAPETILIAVYSVSSAGALAFIYFVLSHLFPKPDKPSYFSLALLSVLSGFGNALVVFTLNNAVSRTEKIGFNRIDNSVNMLLVYFLMGIVLYVVGQRILRPRLIRLTNGIIYRKRSELIGKILSTSYQDIEKTRAEKIQACLNNDIEMISRIVNLIVSGLTATITLTFCFIYLGIMSFYGFLVSFLVILVAAALYFYVGRVANKLWEQTRDIQNVFFKYINDLVAGFKELSISRKKRDQFQADMEDSMKQYRDKRTQGDVSFAGVFVAGELIFVFVMGAVAFLFPLMFEDNFSFVRDYIFVFIYMAGPLNLIFAAIPEFMSVRISWKRIQEMNNSLSEIAIQDKGVAVDVNKQKDLKLELRDVEYEYKNNNGNLFSVGPFNYTFQSGEIVYITGGNGSGKSTMAKLLSGLYKPDKGAVLLNNEPIDSRELGEYFTTVFSDFYLFDRLYGTRYEEKKDEIDHYLKLLKLEGKINFSDGSVNSSELSTGQRKRLAMLISYLEDRPICLFDEWAADQDPEFRKFFYHNLLPELKARGKCIIAITHDDMYFSLADKIIKLDFGQIVPGANYAETAATVE